jgi:hypothetical protein
VDHSFGHLRLCGNYSLGHSLMRESFVGSYSCGHSFVGVIRWVSLLHMRCFALCFCWLYVGIALPSLLGSFHVDSWIRSEDLVWGVLEGNFCTVESL